MRVGLIVGALALIALTAFLTGQAVSQEGHQQPSPEEMQEIMRLMVEAGTPGENHEWLMKMVGSWTTNSTMWMGGPDSPPVTGEGTAEFEATLGGRYLWQEFHGNFMGQPYEGRGISGYDNFRKRFFDIWFDSMSTSAFTMYGHLDATGKIKTMVGEMDEPGLRQVGKIARFVMTFESDDRMVLSAYDLAVGPDAKVMEIAYTRVKPDEEK